MGGRPARHLAGRRELSNRLLGLLLLLLLASCNGSGKGPGPNPLAPLDRAIDAVSADRSALLSAIDVVQRAAVALDDADALCVEGTGGPARKAYRVAEPLVAGARTQGTRLADLVARYRRSLDAVTAGAEGLDDAGARQALAAVVSAGRAEAAAADEFRRRVLAVWPAYVRLAADEDRWTSRSVGGWYRSRAEGAAAYAVMVDSYRTQLNAARRTLEAAAEAVSGPTAAQKQALLQANEAIREAA